MAYQPTPVTDAVQDRTTEKIIFSGSPFTSSILGSGAYKITPLSAPLFYTNPVITGSITPPSVLTCGEGSFNSSPRATLTYQWKRDTVNITDETNTTYNTVASDIGTTITCEVTATNGSGSNIAVSNGLLMQDIFDTYIYELDIMPISGIANLNHIDVNNMDVHLLSGINVPGAETTTSADALVVTGIDVPGAETVSSAEVNVVTGLALQNVVSIAEAEAYVIATPVLLTSLSFLNLDAENAVMTDWTMDSGNVTSVTTAPGVNTSGIEGLRFFKGDDLGAGIDSQMSQEVSIIAGDYADIDTGTTYCVFGFRHMNDQGLDKGVITVEAIDAGVAVLATQTLTPSASSQDAWKFSSNFETPLTIPTLTRKIKITVLFDSSGAGTALNNAYVDDITIDIMKPA